ncbi:MAG TPA: thiamine phosphate synthase [Acidobacteriaceae bacterium]|jgi:thiamine-phosphate pyrophosphorylase|nr:thiamine phosphate synthase [Acidobacteriaceae bacterium]
MLLYAITNRRLLQGDDAEQHARLVALAAEWARGGVDTIQIREKDLPLTELQPLAAKIVEAVRSTGSATRVLVNGPAQVAFDAGADGIHLPSAPPPNPQATNDALSGTIATAIRAALQVYARGNREAEVSAACHSSDEIRQAGLAQMLLFSPVFEKVTEPQRSRGQGLTALRAAAELAHPTPVLALGGVTEKNAAACVQAGAAGVAAIRLFVGEGWRNLRAAYPSAPASVRPSS